MNSSKAIAFQFGFVLLAVGLVLCILAQGAMSMSLVDQIDQATSKTPVTLAVVENPELVVKVLDSLMRNILYSASVDLQSSPGSAQKRGLDLGISRGYSGSQAGKHLMGLSAASFANGPGKR